MVAGGADSRIESSKMVKISAAGGHFSFCCVAGGEIPQNPTGAGHRAPNHREKRAARAMSSCVESFGTNCCVVDRRQIDANNVGWCRRGRPVTEAFGMRLEIRLLRIIPGLPKLAPTAVMNVVG